MKSIRKLFWNPSFFVPLFLVALFLHPRICIAKPKAKDPYASLRKLEILVAVPTHLPRGFQLKAAEIKNTVYNGVNFPDYHLKYCNSRKFCFSIESAFGQVGDGGGGDEFQAGFSKLFGLFSVGLLKPGREGNPGKSDFVLGRWMEDIEMKKDQQEKTWPGRGRYHHIRGFGLSLKEAVKVVETLRPLRSLN